MCDRFYYVFARRLSIGTRREARWRRENHRSPDKSLAAELIEHQGSKLSIIFSRKFAIRGQNPSPVRAFHHAEEQENLDADRFRVRCNVVWGRNFGLNDGEDRAGW